ncbi:MAG: lipopolysaccharide biosynthesis protein [Mycobacteriaceae bacterium]
MSMRLTDRDRVRWLRLIRKSIPSNVATDSVALISTSLLTAGTGLVFWAFAARMISPQELGIQTALLSIMATVGAVSSAGFANSFTALLPMPSCDRSERIKEGTVFVAIVAVALGLIGGCAAAFSIPETDKAAMIAFVAMGSCTMALFALKDAVLTGLGQARRLPIQNLLVSLLKLSILPLSVTIVAYSAVFATLVPAVIAVGVVLFILVPKAIRVYQKNLELTDSQKYDGPTRSNLIRFGIRDGSASALSMGLLQLLPFITNWLAGPVEGATLALALAVSQLVDFVSSGVGAALTTELSRVQGVAHRLILRSWALTFSLVLVSAIGLVGISPILFLGFGHQYDRGRLVIILAILVLGSVARVSFVMWASIMRSQQRTSVLLCTNVVAASVAVPTILYLTQRWQAVGAAAGLTAGGIILGGIGAYAMITGRTQHG